MNPLSFSEKMQLIWEIISSSPLYMIALLIIFFLIYLFVTTNSMNKKESKKAYLLIYLAAFIFFIIQYGSSFGNLLDYTLNQMFIAYYFPNIIIYLLILIITNIILWKTIFNDHIAKVIKLLNSVIFGVLTYLFILVLSLINQLKLNAFNLEELYSSNQVRSLLETSMLIFIIWVLILAVYTIIRKYQLKNQIVKVEEISNYQIVNHSDKRVYLKSSSTPAEKAKVEPEKKTNEPFTLEEYKMMARILKEEKEKKQEEQSALTELNNLYKSIKL